MAYEIFISGQLQKIKFVKNWNIGGGILLQPERLAQQKTPNKAYWTGGIRRHTSRQAFFWLLEAEPRPPASNAHR